MIEPLLLKLRARDEVSAAEEQLLRDLVAERKDHPADRTIIREGEELNRSALLVEGFVARYKDFRDGRRQISALHVPGDYVDLHGFTLKRLDHSLLSLSPCTILYTPHERLRAITEREPHLTRLLWFSTNLDAAVHREWAVSLGRRNALARTAHLLCELAARLRVVGLADEDGFDFPLTQTELAECLGLTSVHVNRVLRELRERGLVAIRSKRVNILDPAGLAQAGEFDGAYLFLEHRPR